MWWQVKGYLKMREAKLMEELWSKEKDLERKVYEYTHHRTSERNSVNLQVLRGTRSQPLDRTAGRLVGASNAGQPFLERGAQRRLVVDPSRCSHPPHWDF